MANTISILIQAQDNASKVIKSVGENVDSAGNKASEATPKFRGLNDHLGSLVAVSLAAGVATHSLVGFMDDSVGAANRSQAALTGLSTIARSFGVDADVAKRAAQELAADGLMTVTDSATGLKNLLASGFSLDESITLMKRFKDSAAFGRQSALSFGQAISSATEGIKNGNSILVDNAGVTKNLSIMLTEAGISQAQLGNASSDAGVRQAIFNGILKETNAQAGDAARLADSAAGKQAVWSAQTEILKQKIGASLQPALLSLLEVVTPIITSIGGWVEKNPELAAGILITVTALTGLVATIAVLNTAVTLLGPVFALFQLTSTTAIAGVSTAFTAFSALVSVPLVMPAIAVAAAIAAIFSVKAAYDEMQAALENKKNASKKNFEAGEQLRASANRRYNAGEIDNKEWKRLYDVSWKALGTNYSAGGLTMVGEHGPELVSLPAGSGVTPAWQTRSQGAQSNGPSVVIENYNSYNERDDNRFFRDLGFALDAR
jgi:uncharacterized membrane protein